MALWLGSALCTSAKKKHFQRELCLGSVVMSGWGILSRDLHVTVNLQFFGLAGTFRWLWEDLFFFPVRSKHRGVGLSGRWKAVNFGANYGEADGC